MLTDRIEPGWIDAFEEVFALCKMTREETMPCMPLRRGGLGKKNERERGKRLVSAGSTGGYGELAFSNFLLLLLLEPFWAFQTSFLAPKWRSR